mmetsp:Transcript_30539/g.46105  ORF Transcript_30539/g.46105 Transcript_30539/m.46105 type:complete len:275 (+) Transcript_30539:339-1163(+)
MSARPASGRRCRTHSHRSTRRLFEPQRLPLHMEVQEQDWNLGLALGQNRCHQDRAVAAAAAAVDCSPACQRVGHLVLVGKGQGQQPARTSCPAYGAPQGRQECLDNPNAHRFRGCCCSHLHRSPHRRCLLRMSLRGGALVESLGRCVKDPSCSLDFAMAGNSSRAGSQVRGMRQKEVAKDPWHRSLAIAPGSRSWRPLSSPFQPLERPHGGSAPGGPQAACRERHCVRLLQGCHSSCPRGLCRASCSGAWPAVAPNWGSVSAAWGLLARHCCSG